MRWKNRGKYEAAHFIIQNSFVCLLIISHSKPFSPHEKRSPARTCHEWQVLAIHRSRIKRCAFMRQHQRSLTAPRHTSPPASGGEPPHSRQAEAPSHRDRPPDSHAPVGRAHEPQKAASPTLTSSASADSATACTAGIHSDFFLLRHGSARRCRNVRHTACVWCGICCLLTIP